MYIIPITADLNCFTDVKTNEQKKSSFPKAYKSELNKRRLGFYDMLTG